MRRKREQASGACRRIRRAEGSAARSGRTLTYGLSLVALVCLVEELARLQSQIDGCTMFCAIGPICALYIFFLRVPASLCACGGAVEGLADVCV